MIFLLGACSSDAQSDSKKEPEDKVEEVKEVKDGVIPVEDLEDRDYGGMTFTSKDLI